jgi:superfamily II DNA helicase RecQ
MTDQVRSLKARQVSAAIMSSSFGEKIEQSLVAKHHDLAVPGKFSLLFAAPEALIGVQGWREIMLSPPLCDQLVAIAVDEAHCVSKW